jgi:hypothetical protein
VGGGEEKRCEQYRQLRAIEWGRGMRWGVGRRRGVSNISGLVPVEEKQA